MRHLLTFISILSLAGTAAASPQSATEESLLEKGARLYQDQQFEGALDVYKEALAAGDPSGPLLYNLGNTYFRTGQLGEAIRYYKKAARRMPDHPKVRHNLNIARQQIDRPIPSMPDPFWLRWWKQLIGLLGPRELFLAGLAAYLPAVGLIGYRIWSNQLAGPLKFCAYFLLIVSVAGIGSGLFASWLETNRQEAVVTAPETILYQDPAANSSATRSIPEGTVVSVNEDLPEWQHVRLPNGATGWVEASRLGDI